MVPLFVLWDVKTGDEDGNLFQEILELQSAISTAIKTARKIQESPEGKTEDTALRSSPLTGEPDFEPGSSKQPSIYVEEISEFDDDVPESPTMIVTHAQVKESAAPVRSTEQSLVETHAQQHVTLKKEEEQDPGEPQ